MKNLRHLLPSFRALIAFEEAGRLRSFTAAGRELGMSQAAISYAIRNLETETGHALFERAHRAVTLTDAGRRLHDQVAAGLGLIQAGVSDLVADRGEDHVTLSVSNAFATLWLAPRIPRMRAELDGIEIRLHTSDRDINIAAEDMPLGVRGGRPENWSRYDARAFAEEEIIAVASPDYLAAHGVPQTPWEFLDHHLAHLDEPHRRAVTWDEWLRSAGVIGKARKRGMRANDYVPVLQLALDGDGIALGWMHLVEPFLRNGRLLQVTGHRLKTGDAFHVVWPKGRALSPQAQMVRDWIVGAGVDGVSSPRSIVFSAD